jgi:hypothetical protein
VNVTEAQYMLAGLPDRGGYCTKDLPSSFETNRQVTADVDPPLIVSATVTMPPGPAVILTMSAGPLVDGSKAQEGVKRTLDHAAAASLLRYRR